jgi:6-phosphogluconolactonase (cycloisomerase 2 family)
MNGRGFAIAGVLVCVIGVPKDVLAETECRKFSFIAEYVNVATPGPNDIAGLDGAEGVAVSPDGTCVYAVGYSDDSIVVFERNPTTGALTYLENHSDGDMSGVIDGLNGARSVVVTPDNQNGNGFVFVAGDADDRIATFEQQPGSCRLSYLGANSHLDLNGPRDLALSPDGLDLLVAAGAGPGRLVTFAINANGTLTHLQTFTDNLDLATCLAGANGVAVSADGNCVYVAASGDDAICVFNRDAGSGLLAVSQEFDEDFGATHLNDARAVAASPDNKSVYAVAHASDALTVATRQAPSIGDANGCDLAVTQEITGTTLNGAVGVLVHPNGRRVFVAADAADSVTHYQRDMDDGTLTLPMATTSNTVLNGAYDLAMAGQDLYVANSARDSVAAYEVDDCCGDGVVNVGEICDHPVCCSADCSTPAAAGTSCNADSNLCTPGDSCDGNGTCVAAACAVDANCMKPCGGGPGTCQVSGSTCTCQ